MKPPEEVDVQPAAEEVQLVADADAAAARAQAMSAAANAKAANEAAAAEVKGLNGGDDGGLLAELKGLDKFGTFCAALEKSGIDLSGGEYTVLAPSDSAFDEYARVGGGPINEDILKYHIIPGRKSLDSLSSDQPTLQGSTLAYERKLRKNWLGGVIIGLMPASDWPSDVSYGNGVIHTIDSVLVPNAAAAAEAAALAEEEERVAAAERARRAWLAKMDSGPVAKGKAEAEAVKAEARAQAEAEAREDAEAIAAKAKAAAEAKAAREAISKLNLSEEGCYVPGVDELMLLSLPNAPNPELSHVDVVAALVRGLQRPDVPAPMSGPMRLHDFCTFECRATLTQRRGDSDGPEIFAKEAQLWTLPGCATFRLCSEGNVIPATQTRGAMATVMVDVISPGAFRFPSGFERGEEKEPVDPTRFAVSKLDRELRKSVERTGSLSMAELEQIDDKDIERYQFVMYQERLPPNIGCWLVKAIVPVKRRELFGDTA